MEYLYNPNSPKPVAHIWTGDDTACKMISTGGFKKGKRTVQTDPQDKKICVMCEINWAKIEFRQRLERV